jgi:tetratricopeptide (TPR) repeat protein
MPGFAARRRRDYRGRAMHVERLTGFCLLARREVLDQVGALDERFGLGFYEDDDLSFRVRDAGYELLVALDVFVHHFGGRTFAGLGVVRREQFLRNFEVFRAKWGAARADPFHPLGQPSPAAARGPLPAPAGLPARRQRVSLCMIVKNEADKLAAALRSVADLVDEMVVVDTGSADATRQVAAGCGARVVDFTWVDDFSAARNESLRQATGDWAFWLDADEWLDEDNRRKLRDLFAALGDGRLAYVMRQFSDAGDGTGSAMAVDQVRLFRLDPAVRWEYRVHEQILLPLRRAGHDVRWTDVVIGHAGYRDAGRADDKLERNLRLLRLQDAERPGDPVTLYHLGLALGQQGRTAEALPLLRRSLELAPPDYSIRAKLHAMLGRGHHRLGQRAEALAACRAGRREHPEDVELLFLEGLLLQEEGDLAGAEAALMQLLRLPRQERFASVDAGLRTYKARHLLGEVYRGQGRTAEAEAEWRAGVAEQPGFGPAWQGLGELWLGQGRWMDLERAAEGLAPSAPLEAMVLRARGHLARREFAEARALLEAVSARAPEAVRPRLLLGRALLQEGRDPAAAEQALRAVLALEPANREAGDHLAALLREQGRTPGDTPDVRPA